VTYLDPNINLHGLEDFVVRPTRRIFLGFDDMTGQRRWTTQPRDSLCIIGPPGYGKTSGILIPTLLSWDGPLVSTSTRGDLFQFAAAQRQRLAAAGGKVFVYDPFGSEPGVTSMGWAPFAGCEAAAVAYRRAGALTAWSTQGLNGANHWRTGAARILRGTFHAAALGGHSLVELRRWLTMQELDAPVEILRNHGSAAEGWADDLEGVNSIADRERSSFYSAALNAIDATVEPTVLTNAAQPGLDIDRFLATKSSLFVIGPRHMQEAVAPLIVGLIESIIDRARELAAHAGGMLADPLLLGMDELANIAPLKNLAAHVSEGGGAGIEVIWTAQSLAAVRERYGEHTTQAILSATTAKIFQGGLSDGADLRNISTWAGEWREPNTQFYSTGRGRDGFRTTTTSGGVMSRQETNREHSVGRHYRPVLPPEAIQQLPPFHGWMFYRSDAPVLVRVPPAGLVPGFAAVRSFTENAPELVP